MKGIKIIGAGIAGLMAAYYFAKNGYEVVVLERKPTLTNDHSAVLRFREDMRSFLPIPLEEAKLFKNICFGGKLHNQSNIFFNNLYSIKSTGALRERSINKLDTEMRFIPPENFYELLVLICKGVNVNFKTNYAADKNDILEDGWEVITTAPLPVTLKMLEISHDISFSSNSIDTWNYTLDEKFQSNVHQTIYFPSRDFMNPAYRISILGNRIVAELNTDLNINGRHDFDTAAKIKLQIKDAFGVDLTASASGKFRTQPLGKLVNINEETRKKLLYEITKDFGVYTLGRFATWREGIMTPDVKKDIMKIKQWISLKDISGYDRMKKGVEDVN